MPVIPWPKVHPAATTPWEPQLDEDLLAAVDGIVIARRRVREATTAPAYYEFLWLDGAHVRQSRFGPLSGAGRWQHLRRNGRWEDHVREEKR